MKRTELERRVRQLKRDEKKADAIDRAVSAREGRSVATYIEELYGMLYFNDKEVMNIRDNVEILELFEGLKDDHPEKQWDNVIRKAIRKTGVAARDKAVDELTELLNM